MNIKNAYITGGLTILVAALLATGIEWHYSNAARTKLAVAVSHPVYAIDFSVDKVLVGSSHNVFVGRVIQQSGTKERGIGPETQFEVEVVENIKGGLRGVVTVNQQGGYKDGVLYIVEGNAELLKPGSTYLFATRYNEKENWHTLNSFPSASKLLSADPNLTTEQLKTDAENDSRVNELKVAYPNEELLAADVASGKTYNDYQTRKSLPNQNTEEIPGVEETVEPSDVPVESSQSVEAKAPDTEESAPTTEAQ